MSLLHGGNHGLLAFLLHHQLHPVLLNSFHLTWLTDKRVGSDISAKLPYAKRLPAAAIVMTHSSASGIEYCLLHRLNMGFGNIKNKLIHGYSVPFLSYFCNDGCVT